MPQTEELYAAATARDAQYQDLRTAPPKIASIASEAASAQSDFLQAHRSIRVADDGSSGVVAGLFGLVVGNPVAAMNGVQGTLSAQATRDGLNKNYAVAYQRNRGAQLSLAALAPEYAGPPFAQPALSIEFNEAWEGATASYDLLQLGNVSGRVLKDALVLVDIEGLQGQRRRNVHYVQEWPIGATATCAYGVGFDYGGDRLGQQTVFGVEKLTVSVWTGDGRSENQVFTYGSAKRDADVRSYLESALKIEWKNQDVGIINNVYAIEGKLGGIEFLGPHKVTIEFMHNSDKVTLHWDREKWTRGESFMFVPKQKLAWWPDSAIVHIAPQGTSYVWTQRLTVAPLAGKK